MSETEARVRLHARLHEDVVPIAYCRHAQARILVREGQATWTEGRLVLTDAIAVRHKGRHPVLAECYTNLDHRAKYSVQTLEITEQILPVIEAVLGPNAVTARLNSYGDTILSFKGKQTDTDASEGWIEVFGHALVIYLNRYGSTHTGAPCLISTGDATWSEYSQETIHIDENKVGRRGPGDKNPADASRSRAITYTTTGDMADNLAFELQVLRTVLEDPRAPLLIHLPCPDGALVAESS